MAPSPPLRLRRRNDRPIRPEGRHVLYWMTAARRPRHNPALEHAVARARELGRPLLVLEALRVGYRWAADRHHAFVLDGMAANARAFDRAGVTYHPYVERLPGEGRGLLAALAADAALVVGDEWPGFFHPEMTAAAAARLEVAMETVDGVGLLPLDAAPVAFGRALDFRRHLQRVLPAHLAERPLADPLAGWDLGRAALPPGVAQRWPAAPLDGSFPLADLAIDHAVPRVARRGGFEAAERALDAFLDRLDRYGEARNQPDADAASGLSPWLHWGHLSAWAVAGAVLDRHRFRSGSTGAPTGKREGWWGLPPSAEAFLDELVTWRELTHNTAARVPGYDRYPSLPAWARATLEEGRADPRAHRYDRDTLEAGATHDPVWNAAQHQLRAEGIVHTYLRMLWGKKVLEWTDDPAEAFETLLDLNNRWAIDGRDPNSVGGVAWVFGRYDRPWAPRRPVFGVIRYMSSANTVRKLEIERYLQRWADPKGVDRI